MPRLFRNHPGYVAMATVVLAVSIGVNLLVFTVVNALWIRPLPFHQPERIVTILDDSLGFGNLDGPQLRIFEGGIAGQVITTEQHEPLRPRIEIADAGRSLETVGVTAGYFKVLGLTIRGRTFSAADEPLGSEPVAIISDRLWASAFGRRADVIGAVIAARPLPLRLIGIAPPGFEGARRGERADVWITPGLVRRLAPPDWQNTSPSMMVFARLGADQTPSGTERQYHDLTEPRRREFLQKYNLALMPRVIPLTEIFGTAETRTFQIREGNALRVVSGLTLLVLLGGCATVAALVLMHYERRRTELAVKMSLGAGRLRLISELARDLTSIAATGAACGVLVAVLGAHAVPALSLPGGVNIGRLDLSIDWRVCAVAIAATALTLFAAAAIPLIRATRPRLANELVAGPTSSSFGSVRVRQALLGLQVCSTIVVLVAAGLFVRAVIHVFASGAGFDVDRTVFVSVQETSTYRSQGGDPRPRIAERAARLMPALSALSGVSDVAEGIPPLGREASAGLVRPRRIQARDRELQLLVGVLQASPNLLSVLGVPIVAGRTLAVADAIASAPRPAVITASLAARLWPDGDALGGTVSLPELRGGPYLVVGVARDVSFGSMLRPASGVIVTAGNGMSGIVSDFVLRTENPALVAGEVQRAIEAQLVRVTTGREVVARDISRQRLGAWFFSGFGVAALLLGVGGAFGLVAYLAESRRREFGVRLALGATVHDLVRHALAAALTPVAAGIAAGLALGALGSQVFSALLVGVGAIDVITYAAVAVAMLGCAAIAALAAAWRLRRTNPSDALRAS